MLEVENGFISLPFVSIWTHLHGGGLPSLLCFEWQQVCFTYNCVTISTNSPSFELSQLYPLPSSKLDHLMELTAFTVLLCLVWNKQTYWLMETDFFFLSNFSPKCPKSVFKAMSQYLILTQTEHFRGALQDILWCSPDPLTYITSGFKQSDAPWLWMKETLSRSHDNLLHSQTREVLQRHLHGTMLLLTEKSHMPRRHYAFYRLLQRGYSKT